MDRTDVPNRVWPPLVGPGHHRVAHLMATVALRGLAVLAVVVAALVFVDLKHPGLLLSAYRVLLG